MAPDAAPTLLASEDWERLEEAVQRSCHPWRDRALLCLFWHLGPTVAEVVGLELDNVNLLSGRLFWPPAGPEVPLPPDLLHALRTYVACERQGRCGALFCGRRGRRMSPAAVNRLFQRLVEVSQVPVSPRLLRRTALWRLLEADPLRAMGAVRRGRAGCGHTAAGERGAARATGRVGGREVARGDGGAVPRDEGRARASVGGRPDAQAGTGNGSLERPARDGQGREREAPPRGPQPSLDAKVGDRSPKGSVQDCPPDIGRASRDSSTPGSR